jgi:hypothetical protein
LLNGKGVSSIEEALKEMELLPLHNRYENFFSADNLEKIRTYLTIKPEKKKKKEEEISLPGKINDDLNLMVEKFNHYSGEKKSAEKIDKKFHHQLDHLKTFYQTWITNATRKNSAKWIKETDELLPVNSKITIDREYLTLLNFIILKMLFKDHFDQKLFEKTFDKLMLSKPVSNILGIYSNGTSIHQRIELLKVLLTLQLNENKLTTIKSGNKKTKLTDKPDDKLINILPPIKVLLAENIVHNLLKVNEFEGITYFNKERFEELMRWLLLFDLFDLPTSIKHRENDKLKKSGINREIIKLSKIISEKYSELNKQAGECGYDLNKFKMNIDSIGINKVKTKSTTKKRKTV